MPYDVDLQPINPLSDADYSKPETSKMPRISKAPAKHSNQELFQLFQYSEEFDFEMEQHYERNTSIEFSNQITISHSLIHLPSCYWLLIKLAIYDSVTVVRVKTNKAELLKFIDLFFEKWENA